ncbi:DNA polymerase domain-containing protein [Oryzomonas japonica]|nr:DNA polymerase domain-containing protein [Oryzomonas japonica]
MQMSDMGQNPLLFGHDNRTGIIAVEPAGPFMRLFFRTGHGVQFHDEPFRPFILLSDPALVSGCRAPCSVRQLAGDDFYRFQLLFDSWGDCLTARDFLAAKTGVPAGSADAPYLFISDLSHQYLLTTGATLFKGLEFGDLRCLALDIETYCAEGFEFSNPKRREDRIVSIALKDSHGQETVLRGDLLDEPAMLRALNEAIQSCDPDVIIGHNIFRFDLEYIATRAALHGIRLTWGRNGAAPHITANSRWALAEKVIDYPRWDVYGRHIIDTYFLVQLYDISLRSLESHGLKQVARHFGIAADERVYLEGNGIAATFDHDPELLYRYNLDDVRETLALFRLLGYPWFLQTRIFPYSFQNCPLRGNATRINALFLREYLHRGHAIPQRTGEAPAFEGGYTESAVQGVSGPIVHCDVASLYPSLMLTYRLGPVKDTLGLFLPMLAELRRFRLEAKRAARESAAESERHYYDALQQVFKVLINSFFGYLGAPLHNFSDPEAAAEVTRLGRLTIRSMIALLKAEGAVPVEVDTDGIYFRPPDSCVTEADEAALVERVSQGVPEGIEVEMDGRYRSMFAYKAKNYALLGYDGRVVIRGSGLRSRGLERYLREFMREAITLLLTGSSADIERLYQGYLTRLRSRDLDVAWVARTETLNESPATYREKVEKGRRNPAAAFEIALASQRVYRAGDQVSYYVGGSGRDATAYEHCRPVSAFVPERPDINIPYYVDKLRHLKQRFEPYLPKEPTLFDL